MRRLLRGPQPSHAVAFAGAAASADFRHPEGGAVGEARGILWGKCVAALTVVAVRHMACCSAFARHVEGVVVGGPDEQMAWTHALSVVARVADVFARWNRAVCELPRDTVCLYRVAPSDSEIAVAIRFDVGRPLPTPVAGEFVDLLPESLSHRSRRWPHVTMYHSSRLMATG